MEIQTILSTFLGIAQEAPMGGSWVFPSLTSLTEHSVPVILIFTYRSLTAALAVLMNVMIRYRKEPASPCSPSTKK